jgi:hypothetical protein
LFGYEYDLAEMSRLASQAVGLHRASVTEKLTVYGVILQAFCPKRSTLPSVRRLA